MISIIMATTSSCQSNHHQVVGKCERSGTREFLAEKILGRKTLCFFRVKWLSVVAAGGSLFPRLRASIRESGRQNAHETVANRKKTEGPGPLLEDEADKMRTRL